MFPLLSWERRWKKWERWEVHPSRSYTKLVMLYNMDRSHRWLENPPPPPPPPPIQLQSRIPKANNTWFFGHIFKHVHSGLLSLRKGNNKLCWTSCFLSRWLIGNIVSSLWWYGVHMMNLFCTIREIVVVVFFRHISTHIQGCLSSSPLHCRFFLLLHCVVPKATTTTTLLVVCCLVGWFKLYKIYLYLPDGQVLCRAKGLGQLDSKFWECLGVPTPTTQLAHSVALFFKQ